MNKNACLDKYHKYEFTANSMKAKRNILFPKYVDPKINNDTEYIILHYLFVAFKSIFFRSYIYIFISNFHKFFLRFFLSESNMISMKVFVCESNMI